MLSSKKIILLPLFRQLFSTIIFISILYNFSNSKTNNADICPVCPDSIADSTINQKPSQTINGWFTLVHKEKYYLKRVHILDSFPQKTNQIIFDTLVPEIKALDRNIWVLNNRAKKYWMCCTYNNTSIRIIKQIDGSIKKIEIIYDTSISNTFYNGPSWVIRHISLNNKIYDYKIPDSISYKDIKQTLSPEVNGWKTLSNSAFYPFLHIVVFEGPQDTYPKDALASLVPDTTDEKNYRCIWLFNPQQIKKWKVKMWFGCYYDNSNVVLAKPIDTNTTKVELCFDTIHKVKLSPPIQRINLLTN